MQQGSSSYQLRYPTANFEDCQKDGQAQILPARVKRHRPYRVITNKGTKIQEVSIPGPDAVSQPEQDEVAGIQSLFGVLTRLKSTSAQLQYALSCTVE